MNLFDFIRWCFRDMESTAATVILSWLLIEGVEGIVRAARSRR